MSATKVDWQVLLVAVGGVGAAQEACACAQCTDLQGGPREAVAVSSRQEQRHQLGCLRRPEAKQQRSLFSVQICAAKA